MLRKGYSLAVPANFILFLSWKASTIPICFFIILPLVFIYSSSKKKSTLMKKSLILLCSIVFIINITSTHAQMRQADSLALVQFHSSCCNTGCTLNWNFTQSMDNWSGVMLGGGRVTVSYTHLTLPTTPYV